MCNLNEITFYDDDVDRWAATYEYVIRTRRWRGLEAALPWAEAHERRLRQASRVRAAINEISVTFVSEARALGEAFQRATESARRLAAALAPADRER